MLLLIPVVILFLLAMGGLSFTMNKDGKRVMIKNPNIKDQIQANNLAHVVYDHCEALGITLEQVPALLDKIDTLKNHCESSGIESFHFDHGHRIEIKNHKLQVYN